jgi:hypothetical protein
MKKNLLSLLSILVLASLLVSCGGNPPSSTVSNTTQVATSSSITVPSASSTVEFATEISSTPDPCSAGQIEDEVQKVHSHMREFDDASILASKLPRDQLTDSVAELQKIRREAEDQQVPACLTDLRKYQVEHMNSVINTLLAFIGGTDATTLEQGIAIARQQHDQYTLELARLLGLTVVPATVPVLGTPDGTATP